MGRKKIWISITEFSEMISVDRRAIYRAIDSGVLDKGKRKRKGIWQIHREVGLKEISSHQPKSKAAELVGEETKTLETPAGDTIPSRHISEAKKAHYIAEKERLNLLERKAVLVNRQDVYLVLRAFGQEVRDSLLNIADRHVDEILSARSRDEAHQLLLEAIASSLDRLTDSEKIDFTNRDSK